MTTLTIRAKNLHEARPLLQSALANEQRVLQAGIQQTQSRLRQFEQQFGQTTAEFLRRFENGSLEETLEFDEWIGEHRLLSRLQDQLATLQELRIEN